MNSDPKPLVNSVSAWGQIAALLGFLLPPLLVHFGVVTDATGAATLSGQIIGVLGVVVGLWGRYHATTPIQGILRSPPQ